MAFEFVENMFTNHDEQIWGILIDLSTRHTTDFNISSDFFRDNNQFYRNIDGNKNDNNRYFKRLNKK